MTDNTTNNLPANNQSLNNHQSADVFHQAEQSLTMSNKPKSHQPLVDLAELLTNDLPWQVHNCKLISAHCEQDEPLPFLYHYDTLADSIKSVFPLNGRLLTKFNQSMTASQADEFIGLPAGSVASPWFIKLKGSVVVYLESMQLAVKLSWSNTIQTASPLYCQTKEKALAIAVDNWQFVGNVHVLNRIGKQTDKNIVVIDTHASNSHNQDRNNQDVHNTDELDKSIDVQGQYIIQVADHYQALPSTFAVALLTALNEKKDTLVYIDTAIRERVI